ncbi:hypothetical protein BM221_001240 [Beauveria bassiana]|uniref:Uncharacterized protein n=1 Tax=Beauveria bassiana TaxID=176275 RepID=A0A2N6P2R9_BEABA|nr:hypothetical protein BM221_001240 [Beauveria bassiana]
MAALRSRGGYAVLATRVRALCQEEGFGVRRQRRWDMEVWYLPLSMDNRGQSSLSQSTDMSAAV